MWCGLIQDAVQSNDTASAKLLLAHSAQLVLRVPPVADDSEDGQGGSRPGHPAGNGANENNGVQKLEAAQSAVGAVRDRVAWAVHTMCTEVGHGSSGMQAHQALQAPNALSLSEGAQGAPVWGEKTLKRAASTGRMGSPTSAATI